MKKTCLSIDQMQKLKELGIKTENASMVLMFFTENGDELCWDEVKNHGKDKPLWEWFDEETEIWETANDELFHVETGNYDHSYREKCGVFTLQDMLELMPELYPTINAESKRVLDTIEHPDSGDTYLPNLYLYDGEWRCGYISFDCGEEEIAFSTDNPLDAAFEMLCWLGRERCIQLGAG